MRHLEAQRIVHVEPHALTLDQAQPLVHAVFIADIEQHLQPQADAEERFALLDLRQDRPGQFLLAQRPHRIGECADAGQHDPVGALDLLWRRDDLRGDADALERLLHRAQVGHPVIDNPDRHHHFSLGVASANVFSVQKRKRPAMYTPAAFKF